MIRIDGKAHIKLVEYLTIDGRSPFRDWLNTLPLEVKARVQTRLVRLSQGNAGDYKTVGHGVVELRLHFGPGYRVYCGQIDRCAILILAGGSKRFQFKDIILARRRFIEFRRSEENG